MHPSYFLNIGLSEEDPARELKLPADFSEWLFHANYWGRVNETAGTSFSQYEEEMLIHQHMPLAMEGLEKIKEVLLKMTASDIRFVYGWNEGREALYCSVSVKALIQNIEGLERFFLSAFYVGADVYCQL